MQVIFYNFTKRKNSTKQPDSKGTIKTVTLKKNTSIDNPTLLLTDVDLSFNYCYIPKLSRYYFINDIVLGNNSVYEVSCSTDYLATYKTEIGNTTSYVLRSASTKNGRISDGMYNTIEKVDCSETEIEGLFKVSIPSGSFVLGVVGSEGSTLKHGTVSYYAMTQNDLRDLCDTIFSESIWQMLKNDYENPLDYIVSCYWVPADLNNYNFEPIHFGRFLLENIEGRKLTSRVVSTGFKRVTLPKHPQSTSKGLYMNGSKYTSYSIYHPIFGNIPLDSEKLLEDSSIAILCNVDIVTGQASLEIIGNTSNNFITKVTAQMGVPVTLSQNNIPISQTLGAIVSGAGALGSFAVGNIAGAISGSVGAIESVAQAFAGNVRTTGSNGSFLGLVNARLESTFIYTADSDNTRFGSPLCESRTLNTLSGFILCKDASINISGLGSDKDSVNSFLNSGFYFE